MRARLKGQFATADRERTLEQVHGLIGSGDGGRARGNEREAGRDPGDVSVTEGGGVRGRLRLPIGMHRGLYEIHGRPQRLRFVRSEVAWRRDGAGVAVGVIEASVPMQTGRERAARTG